MHMQNNKRTELQNHSNISATDSKNGTGTTTPAPTGKPMLKLKPPIASGTVIHNPASVHATQYTAPVRKVIVPVAVPVPMDTRTLAAPTGGAGGGGGSDSSSTDEKQPVSSDMGNTKMVTGVSLLAGAVAGYFIAKKYKKNTILGATLGAISAGAIGYYGYTKFILKPSDAKKSNFAIRSDSDAEKTAGGKSNFVTASYSKKKGCPAGFTRRWDSSLNQYVCAENGSFFVGNSDTLDDLANISTSSFVTSQVNNPKPKKCWCNTTHGTVQCPCGGQH